ncbi:MAG: PAS domain S-box protein [Methanocalculus sp. MSAO_Arc1]|uniref:PAS domain S-box protein n=1 Tax=Methanocalculus TaxID=71151 RepID=UPI000FEF93BD|nr:MULTISPECIES: PAS domain S-box protein [unclassified Methanocalculus]MCP1661691.1 PAS domain S-box-containing protein [Methanocalculus sp. AMF5]RQD81433.1 MAG: PAS domain S-box protein [Methanocalculus sp. MSAO_Arc1]
MASKEQESIPFIALTITTAISLIITLYSLSIGWFIIFQNLYYIPIIIACIYYYKRGFLFSILLAILYFILFASATTDSDLLLGAGARVALFILIAGVITYLAMKRAELATQLGRSNDELTAANEELLASEEEIRSHVDELYSAQQIITETKDRYLALFEAAGDAIFLHRIEADGMPGRFIEVNERACESLGYTRDELLGLTVIDVAGEKARAEAPERMQEFLKRESAIFESDLKRKDGSTFPVEVSARVIRHPDETLILSVVRDITDRRAAEEEILLKNAAIDSSINGIAIADTSGIITYVNPAFLSLWGYDDTDEVIGRSVLDFWVSEEEAEQVVLSIQQYGRWSGEMEGRRKDGSTMPLQLSGSIVRDAAGLPIALMGSFIDITERTAAEAALRQMEEEKTTVLDSMPVMLAYLNPDLTVRYANQVASASVGQKPTDLIGRHCHEIWHGRTECCENCPVVKTLSTGMIEEGEIQIPDGRIFHLKGCPVYGDDGEVEGIIEFGIDITEQRAAENALHITNHKLQLLSSITRHDILNQIMAGLGFLELTDCRDMDPEQVRYLKQVTLALQNIRRQIEFTREYENLGVREPAWLDIGEMVQTLPSGPVPVTNECGKIAIYADPMLEKVFSNLFDNTISHAEGATGIILRCERSNGELVISWEDDGPGIPDDQKGRIFARGFGKNTGFGLFLSREILGITGIEISETGIPGNGARFEIRVPKGRFFLSDETA